MTERRRFLFLSGLALVASTVLAPAWSSAATTPPPPAPTEAPTTAAPPPPTTTQPTEAATTLPTATTPAPTTTLATETTLVPTTTTEAPVPAAPSVVYRANAECDPANGETTVLWKVTNNGDAPVTITANSEDAPLEPNPVPPGGEATATHVIVGPATDEQVTSTVTIDAGGGVVIELSDEITAGACEGPEAPPDVAFALTVTPSVSQAAVGDTVEYVYCAHNTSTIPLAELRLVDDRIGVVLEGEEPIAPGASVCNTDVGAPVSYVVQESDAGSVIHNNAVITAQTREAESRQFQQTATAEVVVPLLSAQPLTGVVTICHATSSQTNTFTQNTVSQSAVQVGGHHYDHESDIIPPGPWAPAGKNWTPAGQTIWNNGCANIALSPKSPTVVPASCVDGQVTAPTVTPVSTTGVSYTVAPPGPYDGTKTTTVTVTAKVAGGFNWSTMPAGWTQVDKTTATYKVTLVPARCDVTTPVTPTVTEAVCRGGVLEPPTLTFVTTDHITYTKDDPGPYAPGDAVVVTATLTQGVWPPQAEMPAGWAIATPTTATHTVTFAAASCAQATPTNPFVSQSACAAGVVTDPSVAPEHASPGVNYTIAPEGPYDGTTTTTVTVTAKVADGYAWASPLPNGWIAGIPPKSTATFVVTLNAASCTPVAPLDPTVVQAECVGGVVTPASVTPATGPAGVTYALGSEPAPGTTVVVTATVGAGNSWVDPLPGEWKAGEPATAARATFTVTLDPAETCQTVTPALPTVVQARCVGGVVTDPSVTLPPDGGGITYSMTPTAPVAGDTVTVTATLSDGYAWGSLTDGWVPGDPAATTATYTVKLHLSPCFPVSPEAPTVSQATCSGGVVTVPTVTPATGPSGVNYTLAPPGPFTPGTDSYDVTVTATLSDGQKWATTPLGWVYVNPTTETFAVHLTGTSCTEVTPVAPTVKDASCRGGELLPPTLELAQTDKITYTTDIDPPYRPLQQVVVTATLEDAGVGWGEMPNGWIEQTPTTATYTVFFAFAACVPVSPEAPTVSQATCSGGVVTVPTVTPATGPSGVNYTLAPPGPFTPGTDSYDVTVTATLSDGQKWATTPLGWVYVNPTTETFAVHLTGTSCTEVTPVAPTVKDASCRGGELLPPTLELAQTDKITYTTDIDPPYRPLQQVVVTATLEDAGVGWGEMPNGWIEQTPTTATYTVFFAFAACVPVSPEAPTVSQATCSGGVVTVPTVTPATGPSGVNYTLAPPGPFTPGTDSYDVTVTATLSDGQKWATTPLGWVYVNPTTETFAVHLTGTSCTEVTPVAPTVKDASCRGGELLPPTLELAQTDKITYTTDIDPPYRPLQQVVVTATLEDAGVGWGEMPNGWIEQTPTTATYTVFFAFAACVPVSPEAPTVSQATCSGGVVTVPTVTPATGPSGVNYTLAPPGPFTPGTDSYDVTVTATLSDGQKWATTPLGWVYVNPTTETFAVHLTGTSCTEVTPVAPTVKDASCRGGELLPPTLELAQTDKITYTTDIDPPYRPLQQVVVTATLEDAGVGWGEMPNGWIEQTPTTATYTVFFAFAACVPVSPEAPTVSQATCSGGVVTVPTVTPATGPSGVNYTLAPPGPFTPGTDSYDVTVTATLSDGQKWATTPLGWVYVNPTTETFAVHLTGTSCTEVTPVAPTVKDASCRGGELLPPTLELAQTDKITYTTDIDPPYRPLQQVVVTATLEDAGVGWGEMPNGWIEQTPTTATYEVTFADVACTPVLPADPVATQATCTGGVVTVPTVTPGTGPAGVNYGLDPPGPYDPGTEDHTVTVTATLTDGLAWGELPDDWTQQSPTTATFTIELVGTTCDEVTPVAPTNHSAQCVAGAVTPPTLTLAETDGITYSVDADPPYAPGQTVEVTATLDDAGVAWPDQLPPGWTATSDTTATYPHTFDDVTCTPVLPVDPVVVDGSCTNGVVTAATLELAATPGLVYVADPAGPYDPTVDTDVVVTATVLDGFAWDGAANPSGFARQSAAPSQVQLPDGWTWVSPTQATFAVALAAIPPCPEAVAPASSVAIEAAESTTTTPGAAAAATTTTPGAAAVAESTTSTTVAEDQTILAETEAASEVAAAASSTTSPATTSVAAAATETTVVEAIPRTGASGVPLQLVIALLSVAGGVLLVIGGRRRIH